MIEKYKYISGYYDVKLVLKMEKPGHIILRSLLKDVKNIPEIVFTASELYMDGINLQRINATSLSTFEKELDNYFGSKKFSCDTCLFSFLDIKQLFIYIQ